MISLGLTTNPGIRFLRDLFGLIFAQVVVKVIGFLIFAYLARTVSQEGYGAIEFLFAVTGFALLVVDFRLGNIGVRIRNLELGDAAVMREIPAVRLGIACLAVPVVLVVVFAGFADPDVRLLGVLFAATLPVAALKQEWVLQSLEKIRQVAFGQALRMLAFAGLALLLVSGPGDVVRVGAAELAAVSLWIGMLLFEQARAGYPLRLSVSWARAGFLLGQAAPLGLSSIAWGVVQYAPPIAVAIVAGLEEAALLAAAQRIVTSLQTLSYTYHFNLYTALLERYRQTAEAMEKLALASIRVIAWAAIGPAVVAAVHAGDLMALAFGAPFRASGPALALLIFVVPAQILSGHQRWALITMGRTRDVLTAALWGAGVALFGTATLVPLFGVTGAAAASILAALTVWAVSAGFCRRHGARLGMSAGLARPALAAIAAALAVPAVLDAAWWVQGLVSLAIYGCAAPLVDRALFPELRHLAYAKKHLAGDRGP